MFTSLDGFSSHAQNVADIHDVQDEYGLMILELLGTDFANRFSSLDGFSSHAQNVADIHDVQDEYGLMISELLGTDFANRFSSSEEANQNRLLATQGAELLQGALIEEYAKTKTDNAPKKALPNIGNTLGRINDFGFWSGTPNT
ncbi:hypothetical protein KIW84_014292 [Lathyrus oleraceus]|uniref:Uncharacterized protein n=1 Tax=Pisum sativum TaxID=3888 RepID=A0A9D5BMR6_PEA|nr:hypothetical protein KIW84_014292 [Pisum sativum]